jgi:hypothetical protein
VFSKKFYDNERSLAGGRGKAGPLLTVFEMAQDIDAGENR